MSVRQKFYVCLPLSIMVVQCWWKQLTGKCQVKRNSLVYLLRRWPKVAPMKRRRKGFFIRWFEKKNFKFSVYFLCLPNILVNICLPIVRYPPVWSLAPIIAQPSYSTLYTLGRRRRSWISDKTWERNKIQCMGGRNMHEGPVPRRWQSQHWHFRSDSGADWSDMVGLGLGFRD